MTTRIEQAVPEQLRLHEAHQSVLKRIRQAGAAFERRRQEHDKLSRADELEVRERRERQLATIDVAREAAHREGRRPPRYIEIQKLVAEHYGLTRARLIEPRRLGEIVLPRQVAIFLIKEAIPSMSLSDVGRRFGGKDHTTVLHALRKVADLIKDGGDIADDVAELRAAIAATPASSPGIPVPETPKKRIWSDADDAALVEGEKLGLGPAELSQQLGIPRGTIWRHGKLLGLNLRTLETPWPEDRTAELITLRDGPHPLSWKGICCRFSCSLVTARTRYSREIALRRRIAQAVSPSPQIAGTDARP